MKISEAKMILSIMAGENEVSLEAILAVMDMIDDLGNIPRLQSELGPHPKGVEGKLCEVSEQTPSLPDGPEVGKPADPMPETEQKPKKVSKGKEPTKDCCRNCFYASKTEMTFEDGSKHPGRKCSKDGRTHSDDGICSKHLRRGKKSKETEK